MKPLRAVSWVLVLLLVGTLPLAAQTDLYARKYIIPYPAANIAWGDAVAGVDFDGDGLLEIYAVNNNMYDAPDELIPAIYKYELDTVANAWNIVWGDTLTDILGQNTWPALTYGDWDQDGKMEIIWGPVNNFVPGNETPDRIIVYEEAGDGSDVMGVDDGAGGYRPNARWNIVSEASFNLRPFRWELADMDYDGELELVFCERASSSAGVGFKVGVVSVSDIPDNGDGSETWTLEASGNGIPTAGNTVYDIVVIDSTAFAFHATATNGTVTRIRYRNGAYIVDADSTAPKGVTQGGGFKNAAVADFDGDGVKEIMMGSYAGSISNDMTILQVTAGGDSLVGGLLFDPTTLLGGGRIAGSAVTDVDNDGNIDVLFGGGRDCPTPGAIMRVEYKGAGDVLDPASYDFSILESGYGSGSERIDFVHAFNLDADPEPEILFGSAYGGDYDYPMVILDRVTVASAPEPIADVRVSTNADLTPDRAGQTVTVMGTVTSINMTASANRFSYNIQDANAGVNITKASQPLGGPVYAIGDRLIATGVVGQFSGVTQLDITGDLATDVIPMGPVYQVAPITLTIDQYLADAEAYESRLIKFNGMAKTATSASWPNPGSSANMTFWDGSTELTLRIDSDSDIDDSVEVTYPVNVQGSASQFDNSAPYDGGYQIIPNFYSDFTQGVSTSPNPNFALQNPADGSTVVLDDAAQVVTFDWAAAVDLDGSALTYQWYPVGGSLVPTGNSGADTLLERTGAELLTFLGAADTVELKWTVFVKDDGPAVLNRDTSSVTLVRGAIVGVGEEPAVPTSFALQQNYPNPFNPTTTIRYALPVQSSVRLRIYDVVGREVATLVDGVVTAGYHSVDWNSTNSAGALLSSGMYFYRLEARPTDAREPFVEMKKMMLLK